MTRQFIYINSTNQSMTCYQDDNIWRNYLISTGKNGMGEQMGSERTPRGWHRIHAKVGMDAAINSVFTARVWTGEIYTEEFAQQNPGRDWILTRILQLDGLESGRNQGGEVDSLTRYIYIHGTPDSTTLGVPGSRGCIRMRNHDVIELAAWIELDSKVFIE